MAGSTRGRLSLLARSSCRERPARSRGGSAVGSAVACPRCSYGTAAMAENVHTSARVADRAGQDTGPSRNVTRPGESRRGPTVPATGRPWPFTGCVVLLLTQGQVVHRRAGRRPTDYDAVRLTGLIADLRSAGRRALVGDARGAERAARPAPHTRTGSPPRPAVDCRMGPDNSSRTRKGDPGRMRATGSLSSQAGAGEGADAVGSRSRRAVAR
jgi:hypothetical protein